MRYIIIIDQLLGILNCIERIIEAFSKVMQCDVTRCIICISNEVQYLNEEPSYKHFTKEVILCNAVDKTSCHRQFKYFGKFCVCI